MRAGQLPKARLFERLTGTALSDPVVGARVREAIRADISGAEAALRTWSLRRRSR